MTEAAEAPDPRGLGGASGKSGGAIVMPPPSTPSLMYRNPTHAREAVRLCSVIAARRGHCRIHVAACKRGYEVYTLAAELVLAGLWPRASICGSGIGADGVARAARGYVPPHQAERVDRAAVQAAFVDAPDGGLFLNPALLSKIRFVVCDPRTELPAEVASDIVLADHYLVRFDPADQVRIIRSFIGSFDTGEGVISISGRRDPSVLGVLKDAGFRVWPHNLLQCRIGEPNGSIDSARSDEEGLRAARLGAAGPEEDGAWEHGAFFHRGEIGAIPIGGPWQPPPGCAQTTDETAYRNVVDVLLRRLGMRSGRVTRVLVYDHFLSIDGLSWLGAALNRPKGERFGIGGGGGKPIQFAVGRRASSRLFDGVGLGIGLTQQMPSWLRRTLVRDEVTRGVNVLRDHIAKRVSFRIPRIDAEADAGHGDAAAVVSAGHSATLGPAETPATALATVRGGLSTADADAFDLVIVSSSFPQPDEAEHSELLRDLSRRCRPDGLLVLPCTTEDRLGSTAPLGLRPVDLASEGTTPAPVLRLSVWSPGPPPCPVASPNGKPDREVEAATKNGAIDLQGKADNPASAPVIRFEGVHLSFPIRGGSWRNALNIAGRGHPRRRQVIKGCSFEIWHGDVVGIIGRNGAGKSTLLRLMAGIFHPDSGTVDVDGSVRLLAVGLGLNPNLTGRANVKVMGRLLGLDNDEIRERMSDVLRFTELEEVIDEPVRYYSSGMRARLAFATATLQDTDVLLLDEVFVTGDRFFIAKAASRIRRNIEKAKAVVLVSHQLGLIRKMCNKVIWMENGRILAYGPSKEVISAYAAYEPDDEAASEREER